MNQHLSSEPDFTPDPKNNDASVNYLRRLKAEIEGESPARPAVASSQHERRRSPRFRCTGSAAIAPNATEVHMWGTVTDISLRGCYVEMSSTLPVDTKVGMVLDVAGIRVRAKGIVRISYPGLGMGILITELPHEQREFLDQMLALLAQDKAAPGPPVIPEKAAAHTFAAVDATALLNELQRFFHDHPALSREEFYRIADRCRRR